MGVLALILFLVSSSDLLLPISSSSHKFTLTKGSSLSSEDFLSSKPKAVFTAGFFSVGENAYCFAIWFTEPYDGNYTIVWMANRDQPVNGRNSKLSLQKSGNLVLTDAGQITVWTSNTKSNSSVHLQLQDNGNLLLSTSEGENLWQSFDSPTNTLLPEQLFTAEKALVSSRSLTNYSSGFYKLFFDNDNVIRLLYQGPEIRSLYWPDPWLVSWEGGRSTYNNSKIAKLDLSGHLLSSDELEFQTSDYGIGPQRRLTVDVDGSLRVYSLDKASRSWKVSWQADAEPCKIHGICGANSLCTYTGDLTGRKCSCLPGYKLKNQTDWSYGCKPEFKLSCNDNTTSTFLQLPHAEFYGYDIGFFSNYTLENCKNLCLQYCDCKAIQYKFDVENGFYNCWPKTALFNGYRSPGFEYPMYIRLPRANLSSFQKSVQDFSLGCKGHTTVPLDRIYRRKVQNGWVNSFLWSTLAVGAVEIICLIIYFYKTRRSHNAIMQGYLQVATGFRKFTYAELKKATRNFSQEIGRGGSGIVYKGILWDNRVAAIKCLKEANQGEAEFLAEVSIIGRLNHINLIETWGYCAEGKHRLLVYEYMEHGSLAKNLHSDQLDWKKRYEIALGTAKGLAYLHEECLEWVLHCDVKPQNILLNDNYQPKVADFGLSKLLIRGEMDNSNFSRIRGTRGYMAPEWVFNLPITSKVDVYSYGIVLLELVTGKSPGSHANDDSGQLDPRRLVTWVKENMRRADTELSKFEEIVDPAIDDELDERMEILVKVALQCAEEDKDARPTMSQVVDILLHQEFE